MTTSNLYRKARALLAKTEANGCTNGEAASALQTASDIIVKHGLDPDRLDWPQPPAGYRATGKPGVEGYRVEKAEEPEPKVKTKKPSSRKKPVRHHQPGEPTQPERMFELLRRAEGVSLEELVEALDIQPHSARALVSVHARRRAGLNVRVIDGRYRIVEDT